MSFIYSGWLADESVCLARLFLSLSSISEAVKALLATIDFVDGPALAVGPPIFGYKGEYVGMVGGKGVVVGRGLKHGLMCGQSVERTNDRFIEIENWTKV